jgi:hypothetical protein
MKDKDVSDMEERGPPMKQFINAWPKLAVILFHQTFDRQMFFYFSF